MTSSRYGHQYGHIGHIRVKAETAILALHPCGHIGHHSEMANRIAEWRTSRGLSYRGLSDLVGCDPKTIERLEKGHRRLTIEWMERISKALAVQPEDLLPSKPGKNASGEDSSPPNSPKKLLLEMIAGMTDEQASDALRMLDLAKKFGGGKGNDFHKESKNRLAS